MFNVTFVSLFYFDILNFKNFILTFYAFEMYYFDHLFNVM